MNQQDDSFVANLASAHALLRAGNVNDAVRSFESIHGRYGASHDINWPLVQICLQLGQGRKAEDYLCELVHLYPDEVFYVEQLANILSADKRLNEAISAYKEFVKRQPNHAVAHFNLAYAQKQSGDFEGAIASYKKALENNISEPEEVYSNMSLAQSALEQHDRAVESLQKALAINPTYRPALFNLAARYEEAGKIDDALTLFEKVNQQQNGDPNALSRIADLKKITDINDPIVTQLKSMTMRRDLDILTAIDVHFALGKVMNDCAHFEEAFHFYSVANSLSQQTMPAYDPDAMERQIGRIMEVFSKDQFAERGTMLPESPLFVCGMFRSGTTLTEQILAAHQDVTSGGEIDYFSEIAAKQLAPFPEGAANLTPEEFRKIGTGYLAHLNKLFPGASIITDKRPDNFLYLGLVKRIFPSAKIICTNRQPIDNCLSVFFHHLGKSMNYALSLQHTAHYLQQHRRLMAYWKSLFGDSIYEVSYDALVAKPEKIMRELVAFCALDWDPNCLSFYAAKNTVKTASSWQVRQPLYTQSSGRWRNYEKHVAFLKPLFEE